MFYKIIDNKTMKKHLQLIVEIKDEDYDYEKESYRNLIKEVHKLKPLVNQLLIDVKKKRVYCYLEKYINNLIA